MLEKNAKTKYRKINIDENKRVLFISDIHGDLKLFKRALQKVDYRSEDYLFLIGDIIEKGTENLDILDFLKDFKEENPNVYLLSGNCDEVFRFIIPPVEKEKFLYYALEKRHSIINEMAIRLNVNITNETNVDELCTRFYNEFKHYYDFIDTFDDVININDKIILVHAGIINMNNIPENKIDVLKLDNFYFKSPAQDKLMIVGHYPTVNYCKRISSLNPIFDFKKNIICIDGGNNVCRYGQLNIVILDSLKSFKFSFKSVDHFPKIKILKDINYTSNEMPFSLITGENEIKILDVIGDFAYCEQLCSGRRLYIYEQWIYRKGGKLYAYDATNLFVPFKAGSIVTLILYAQPFCIVKKEGVLALVRTKDLVMQDATA